MAQARALIAGLFAALALTGCLRFGPKPFEMVVKAAPLREIASSAAEGPALPQRTRPDAPAPSPTPARTDVRGAGDGSMKVDTVVVNVSAKDIPHRAANYSPEQTASMICLTQKLGFAGDAARRAHLATLEARDMRAKFAADKATLAEVDAAELKRQTAVREFQMPIPLLNMVVGGGRKKENLPPQRAGDMVLENVDLFTFKENGKEVIAVSGSVHNTGSVAHEAPPLTMHAIDQWDWVLAGQTALLPFEQVKAGETREFEVRFLNPPEYTFEVYVHFAPPFSFRGRRDCEFFDPSTFDVGRSFTKDEAAPEAKMAPRPAVGAGAPEYRAQELNALMTFYRRESALAYTCSINANDKRCSGAEGRLNWRDMFLLAESIDEAWIALRAADESRRRLAAGTGTQAEADKAELARQAGINLFVALGEKALARGGGSAADVAVEMTSSTYGLDKAGLFVEIAGRLHNTGASQRDVASLMIALVDSHGLPLSTTSLAKAMSLKPGENVDFAERVPLTRQPPEGVDWSVRVGAMAK